MKFAAALPSTNTIGLFCVLKIRNLGPWRPEHRNVLFLCCSMGSLPRAAERSCGEGRGACLEVTSSVVTALEVTSVVV